LDAKTGYSEPPVRGAAQENYAGSVVYMPEKEVSCNSSEQGIKCPVAACDGHDLDIALAVIART